MIYYVEDDTNIRDLTIYALKQGGFEAEGFERADEFYAAVRRQVPELVLLDIMLPEVDGLEILRELRNNPATKHIPIMMLTAKGTEYDTVCGLDAGADDYLAKPFGMMELVSRVNALLRRAGEPARQPAGCADGRRHHAFGLRPFGRCRRMPSDAYPERIRPAQSFDAP